MTIDRHKGRRFNGHGGSINGFNAWIQSFPEERLSVVLLTNTGGAAYAMAPELVETIFGALDQ
jgi:CubicO group peptidase (beta-lactamase class C family)